jgi:hypothetical protein
MDRNVSISTGSVFPSLLAVLFIGLKLTGSINWPWIWVLGPLWIPLALILSLLAAGLGFSWLSHDSKSIKGRV